MTEYIDKAAIVAEIENRISNIEVSQKVGLIKKSNADMRIGIFKNILSLLDTIEVKKPSLPSNLDEVAKRYESYYDVGEEHGYLHTHRGDIAEAFKDGAEWMAEQGYIEETKVGRTHLNGPNGIEVYLHDSTGFKEGDKVIVQIRKAKEENK